MQDIEVIAVQLRSALWECCSPSFARSWSESRQFDETVSDVTMDVGAFAEKDPAAYASVVRVLQTYTSFKAVLHYRLAHAIARTCELSSESACYAELISSRGKLLSGAELNSRSTIGKRFVLDHGVGTVIGETAVIGDDCYILGGVTLGAVGIAGNPAGKRHPVLGNRVQVGAFTRVLGHVEIGDDVFIGPHCVITKDIPSGSTVTVRTSVQVTYGTEAVTTPVERIRGLEHEA